jgi:acetylornithine deacetylase/succinyl-diaminopimelate desuccinylase-like protein
MAEHEVLEKIDGQWITDEAERLVRVPSVTLNEQEVCQLYEQQLRELGLKVDVREVTPGMPNLYARVPGEFPVPTPHNQNVLRTQGS